jgi:hypothetical protein
VEVAVGSLGMAPLVFVLSAHAAGGAGTTDTTDTTGTKDTVTTDTTGTVTTGDTASGDFCAECGGAADISGEAGGSPCEDGCSHAGGPTSVALLCLVGAFSARRRRA